MKQETIDQLECVFTAEKRFFKDGYYRIRSISDEEKELAFLVVDGCGATAVHPQITIMKHGEVWQATKLIDLQVTPPKIIQRTTETAQQLDQSLQLLVHKFQQATQAL